MPVRTGQKGHVNNAEKKMPDNWYSRKQQEAARQQVFTTQSLQKLLTRHGFPLIADGISGRKTTAALRAFQKKNGLRPDGVAGEETWEALKIEETPPVTISFQTVADLFPQMEKQKYTLHNAQCPSNPLGMKLRNIGEEKTNCVQFTAWLLSHAFQATFSRTQWKRWMVSGSLQGSPPVVPNWGPKVILEWGCGTTAPGKGAYLVQSFTKSGGHSYIIVDYDEKTGKILTLEATQVAKLDGAGWREIGNLRDVHNPGIQWADKVTQTWDSRVQDPNVAVHIARLSIDPDTIQDWLKGSA